jgi:uncharacterized membrane protein YidH (DUF202 family)
MPRFEWRFWMAAFIAAWAFDLLTWKKPLGVSFFIWVAVLIIGGLVLARLERIHIHWRSIPLMVLTLAFATLPALRAEEFTRFIGAAFAMGGLVLLVDTLRNGNWWGYRILDYFRAVIVTAGQSLIRPITARSNATPTVDAPKRGSKVVWSVVRGLLITIPILLVLGALLASADPIFGDALNNILKVFEIENLSEYLFRLFYILVLTFLFTGAYLHAVLPTRDEPMPDPEQAHFKPFLGFTETSIILTAVNLLFAVFVAVQFRYFFGGQANITASGYTYSEYAVRGFTELVIVALLSLGLYQALQSIARRESKVQKNAFIAMVSVLMALVLVILVSSFQRVILYEQAYGWTQLRTYTFVFIPWLGALLLTVIGLQVLHKPGRLAFAILVAALGFGATLATLNVDQFIARQNLNRAMAGKELDASYLAGLSEDALPELVGRFEQGNLPKIAQDALGARLACRTMELVGQKSIPWQGFNLSEVRGKQLLLDNQALWQAYPVRMSTTQPGIWEVRINGTYEPCQQGYID